MINRRSVRLYKCTRNGDHGKCVSAQYTETGKTKLQIFNNSYHFLATNKWKLTITFCNNGSKALAHLFCERDKIVICDSNNH